MALARGCHEDNHTHSTNTEARPVTRQRTARLNRGLSERLSFVPLGAQTLVTLVTLLILVCSLHLP